MTACSDGTDYIYGGSGEDTLIADNRGDRLIDWYGNNNKFIVPHPSFGAATIIRSPSQPMRAFLLALAEASGSTDPQYDLCLPLVPEPAYQGANGQQGKAKGK